MTILRALSISTIAIYIASCSAKEHEPYPRDGSLLTNSQYTYLSEAAAKINDTCPIDSFMNREIPMDSPEFQQSLVDHATCEMSAIYATKDEILIDWTVHACLDNEHMREVDLFDKIITTREDYIALCASGRVMSISHHYNWIGE